MTNNKKYIPPHLRTSNSKTTSQCWKKTLDSPSTARAPSRKQGITPSVLFFGDSFVRLFGLIDNPNIKVRAFKGASAKGIGRDGNGNRTEILQQVQQLQPDRVVLCFGNVDVHLSYYYTKYGTDGPTIDLRAVAQKYVEFAATLPVNRVHIVGVYPSPLSEENVAPSLRAYHAISHDTVVSQEDICIHNRQRRVQNFNQMLQQECEKTSVAFDSAFSEMVDCRTNALKPAFQDVSLYNIHVVWETTILVWLQRWQWLRKHTPRDFEEKIQGTLKEYLRTKPWAITTHPAANIGVGEAFDVTRTET
ncbi:hypothetical protein IV203_021249 [Nitzschia inconspicua]|uniref:Uncharacterized protein n=1 Tax=Nitzschia inconspicua TaxID=303405 RepID=A0A9K3PFT5_9STRA|nr:hypothetical protein IV203_021249 [Nitzschia inconspicua]